MRNPNAGPAAYLLLRGEGSSEDATSPAESASCLGVSVLHSSTNVCTLGHVQLGGIPIRDEDVFTLAGLLRSGGFDDVADKLTGALLLETKVLALTVVDRESILRALDETPTDGLAELRCVLLQEHEWRVREGLVSIGRRQTMRGCGIIASY
jgi:hypothetical protein